MKFVLRPHTPPEAVRPSFSQQITMILVMGLLLLAIQGCADLKAIQDFAALSADSAEYTTLVNDYIDSPQRQKRYQPESRQTDLDRMTQERNDQKPSLLLRHAVIEKYMSALGALAADEAVDHSTELSELATALKTQAGTSPKETEAFGKMAGILTKVVSDRWRQRQLRDLIEQSNDPVQQILSSLQQIIGGGFVGDLDNEQAALQNYYRTLTMESNDPAGKAALQEWQEFRMNTVNNRRASLQRYADLLQSIAAEHQQLYDQRHDLTNPNLLKQVGKQVKDLRKLLSIVQHAS